METILTFKKLCASGYFDGPGSGYGYGYGFVKSCTNTQIHKDVNMSRRGFMITKTKVLAFLQEKGGAGKTTIATNVACGLKNLGLKVLLVDADPQGSARDWSAESGGEVMAVIGLDRETIATDIKAVMSGYDVVIIDGAPQLTKLSAAAVKASDVVIIPVQPSPYDVWASSSLVDLIKTRQEVADGKPEAAFLVSRAIKNTKLNADVGAALKEYGLPILEHGTTQRVAYPTYAAKGLPVFEELSSPGAGEEMAQLVNEIARRFLHEHLKSKKG
jgi:chromosome partitioning protein